MERLARENPSVTQYQSGLAESHNSVGVVQRDTGHPTLALASYEQARAIRERLARENPESPDFASNLGATLNNMAMVELDQRQFDSAFAKLTQAIAWQRKALATNANHRTYRQFLANHLANLIAAAEGLGRVDDAAKARRQLDELRHSDPRMVALDARLASVINGKETPRDDSERIGLAYRAHAEGIYACSARLFAQALEHAPKLADDRQFQHAYNAACAAALAASGQGKDDPPPDDAARAKLRTQARDWLKAELAAWAQIFDNGPAELKTTITPALKHWKDDSDVAGIRDEKELAKLPEAERTAFTQLWNDVDQLLTKAAGNQ